MTMDTLLDRAIRTQEAIEEANQQAQIEEALRIKFQSAYAIETKKKQQCVALLEQLAQTARIAQENPTNEIEERVGADEHEVEVLEALNGLEAIIQGVAQGGGQCLF